MREALALIAYGLLLLGGAFTLFFWGQIAIRRFRDMGYRWAQDKYCLIATFLTLTAVGTTLFFSARAYQFLVLGFSTVSLQSFSSYIILLGLYIMVAAITGFVWVVHCRKSSRVWCAFLVLSGIWLIGATLWVLASPIKPSPYGG